MANNRMFLVHRPTGKAVTLGKRMGRGWYGVPPHLGTQLMALFELAENASTDLDDFALAMEDAEGASGAVTGWTYDGEPVDGIFTLKLGVT
jgi:hypothetical protein